MIKSLKSIGALASLIVRGVKYLLRIREKKKVDDAIEQQDTSKIDNGRPTRVSGVQHFPKDEIDKF